MKVVLITADRQLLKQVINQFIDSNITFGVSLIEGKGYLGVQDSDTQKAQVIVDACVATGIW